MKKAFLLTIILLTSLVPAVLSAQSGSDYSAEISSLKSRLAELQSAETSEPAQQAKLTDYYTRSIAYLESAKSDREQARVYSESLKTAPATMAQIQLELKGLDTRVVQLPDDLESLEQELLNSQAELLQLNSQLSESRIAISSEQELDLSVILTEALQQLTDSQNKLSAPLSEKSADMAEAQRTLRTSEVAANTARVEKLQQQSLSRDARMSEWRARQRLISKKIDTTTQRVAALQSAVNELRQSQANVLAQQAEMRAAAPDTDTGLARELADQNSVLAKRMADITRRTDDLSDQLARLRTERARIDRYYASVSQQLAVSGANRLPDLGAELLEQKRKLSQLDSLTLKLEENDKEIARAQLELLRLEDRQTELPQESSESDSDVTEQLQAQQLELLQAAAVSFRRYIDALTTTRAEGLDLQLRTRQYSDLLESRLFWIPSTQPVSWSLLVDISSELKWLLSASQWRQVGDALNDHRGRNIIPALIIIGLTLLLFRLRGRLKRKLAAQAFNIGKVHSDTVMSTWIALFVSLLLALPGPLTLLSISILISGGAGFAANLATGLNSAALVWFLLASFWWICSRGGLAEKHFKWSASSLQPIRQSLPWVMRFLVPVTLLSPLVTGASENITSDALSQVLLTIASLVLVYFALSVLRPNSVLMSNIEAKHAILAKPLRYIVVPVVVLMPLILMVMSWFGYHFTALELEGRLFVSLVLVVLVALLYNLAMRSIAVTERRMMLERALKQRRIEREANSARKAADDAAEGLPEVLELPGSDLQTLNSQTISFLRMLAAGLAGFGLWNLWSDVLPALSVFNEIILWHIAPTEAHLPDKVVTLADLIVVGVVLFLTYFGARNIPGSLEITVLRRFKLEPGTSYATTTIVKYIIVFAGVMVTLNMIGAQWSKLQWLIAALGVGLGFGLQEIVANFVSGLLILFERPVRVGDVVTVGNHTGTVSKIRMRATTLTDWDRKEQIVPNKTFITESLTNWTLSDPINRVILRVGVAYGSDIELVHKLLTESIAANKRVIADPSPQVFFIGFGESSLDFEIRVFIQSMMDLMPVKHELNIHFERALREHGIEIPFPQRDLWIRTEAKPASAEDLKPKQ